MTGLKGARRRVRFGWMRLALVALMATLALPAAASADPIPTTAPTLTGDAFPGGNGLVCSKGGWSNDPNGDQFSYSFEFFRDGGGVPIGGTSGDTYDPVPQDAGHSITCKVTADDGTNPPVTGSASNSVDITEQPPQYQTG
jgi:hypothetical protein